MYATQEEEAHKFLTFKANFDFVQKWNADVTQTSTVGLNEYADLNTEEFSALKGCLNIPSSALVEVSVESTNVENVSNDKEAPTSWNWAA